MNKKGERLKWKLFTFFRLTENSVNFAGVIKTEKCEVKIA